MRRSGPKRGPGKIGRGRRHAVFAGAPDGGDRAPELVAQFGVGRRDPRIVGRHVEHRIHTGVLRGAAPRLLEHAGATEARVVVRDLPAPASSTTPTASTPGASDSQLDTGAGSGAGAGRSTDQHAGTRADHTARDGAEDRGGHRGAATSEVRTTEMVSGSRGSGVDLAL